jgi:hypothetical protein
VCLSTVRFFAFPPFVALLLFCGFLVWNGVVFALFAAAEALARQMKKGSRFFKRWWGEKNRVARGGICEGVSTSKLFAMI